MEDFSCWSMQYAAEPCLAGHPSDDDVLFGAFLGGGFDLRSDHGGLNLPSSHPFQTNFMPSHGGASLSVSDGFMGLDTADMFASVTGALDDGGLLDTFAYGSGVVDAAAEEPAQPTASSNAFSGYSSTTGGYGNISSGESNTCGGGGGGGHDTEVASSPCALPRPALPQATAAPASKRKLSKYPAIAAATSTEAQVAAPRCGTKRDSATSSSSTSITFAAGGHGDHHHHAVGGSSSSSIGVGGEYEPDSEAIAQVKEMIYRAAAMRPVHQLVCGVAEPSSSPNKPRRKNVRISSDPQTVAARLRRGRVSERLRVLQRLVPGGSRMDTASMLGEAASYLKFLKSQVKALERANPSSGGYHNSSPLPQSYTGSLGGGTSASTVPDFGGDGAIGGYVKSDRNMHL